MPPDQHPKQLSSSACGCCGSTAGNSELWGPPCSEGCPAVPFQSTLPAPPPPVFPPWKHLSHPPSPTSFSWPPSLAPFIPCLADTSAPSGTSYRSPILPEPKIPSSFSRVQLGKLKEWHRAAFSFYSSHTTRVLSNLRKCGIFTFNLK